MFETQTDTCKNQLSSILDKETMKEFVKFINCIRESRHIKTLNRQTLKFNWLCQWNTGGHSNVHHGKHDHVQHQTSVPEKSNIQKNKWVINISSKPLTAVQESLLSHRPNFVVVPRGPPIVECVTVVEQICQKLVQGEADELSREVKAILKKAQPPRQNITKEEQKAITELRKDNTRIILTADKGISLVVMNKEDYVKKAEELLNEPTYRTISSDPTTKYKNKLINLLKTIKTEGGMDEALYRRLYPPGAGSHKYYGLPKIHKEGIPLRSILSSIGAVSHETSNELARILKPLVGKSPYHAQNTQDFIQHIQDIKLEEEQCIMSYDVKALFTSVPIQPATSIITKLLLEDLELQQRTSLSVDNIASLLKFLTKEHLLYISG